MIQSTNERRISNSSESFKACWIVLFAAISESMDSAEYQAMLYNNLIPLSPLLGGASCIFKQDNASCHTSKPTNNDLKKKKVNILPWPSGSLDLNPMKNVWGILSLKVYANNKQFSSANELEVAIAKEQHDISDHLII
ncbi:hypothetical protein AVEN_142-1 [Araneus ventricosus]|uniref:Tc1-like transposase DDE domain-containing protein n=1 Tax=Araneus ventricosus TaxID=182803 RepID=A0A4Y2D215_ARAVE|nr:hypothetical protein AVEN_142-1 [Araneus ventricosus]